MADAHLPGVFGDVQPVLEHYGYLGVGGMLFLEDFGVPVPGEIMLIAAAVFAGAGQMNIAVVFLVGVLAAVIATTSASSSATSAAGRSRSGSAATCS